MQVEAISNGNLRIWLTEEEADAWGVTEGFRQGIRRLVHRALTAAGQRPTMRVTAEMIPVEGGCVVLVSPAVHNHRQPTVYRVDADALSQVNARWHPLWETTALVYAMDGAYYVVSYGKEADSLLREYGCPVGYGEGAAAHTAEYGQWRFTVPAPALPDREGRER